MSNPSSSVAPSPQHVQKNTVKKVDKGLIILFGRSAYGFFALVFAIFRSCAKVLYRSANLLQEKVSMTHNEAANIIKYMVKLSPLPPLPNDFIFGSYPPEALKDNSTNPLRDNGRNDKQKKKKENKQGHNQNRGGKGGDGNKNKRHSIATPLCKTQYKKYLKTLETYQAIKYMTIMIKAKVCGCRMIKSKP